MAGGETEYWRPLPPLLIISLLLGNPNNPNFPEASTFAGHHYLIEGRIVWLLFMDSRLDRAVTKTVETSIFWPRSLESTTAVRRTKDISGRPKSLASLYYLSSIYASISNISVSVAKYRRPRYPKPNPK